METVSITIDGKIYRMACDAGQEEYLIQLAAKLDQYIAHLKKKFGEIGDQRLSIMAGIMIMDEMEEIKRENKKLQESYAALLQQHDKRDYMMSQVVTETTKRIEKITQQLLKENEDNTALQE
ncbi:MULTISPECIES: cell division protein ZapA [unclassified Bartonella]|uniref:cell division protein ZapA n=1 Tax=unclassified Bartonella TaxID=2645622 RepID=UPI000999F914|nr:MULTISPECIES: cell division protein ZapA [unclassified Bartonella]AQX28476.1 cell division protein ZapA [Bartonella sp. JB15]AQX29742.1 cell division protein ZapA [Bartonella sp. JB63]